MLIEFLKSLTASPWIYLIGWGLTAATFFWKMSTDSKYARYRETIAFIEKREATMRERWKSISNVDAEFEGKSEEVYAFFGQLELISLLVSKKAFDKEIVYNFWWRYFDEPLRVKALNTWLQIERESDSEMFIHYCDLCKEWAKRIDREQGRQIR